MRKTPADETKLDPRWVTFWRRVKVAAEELRQVEADQANNEQQP